MISPFFRAAVFAAVLLLYAVQAAAQPYPQTPIHESPDDTYKTEDQWLAFAEASFKERDTNHDGKISREEGSKTFGPIPPATKAKWMQAARKRFKRIDTGGDGVITKKEMAEFNFTTQKKQPSHNPSLPPAR